MFLLPYHLQEFFERMKGGKKRVFADQVETLEVADLKKQGDEKQDVAQIAAQEIDIYPKDPFIRKQWFSLTIREREVAALVCMGYKNHEIASKLGIGYQTELSYLQNIFEKFNLRSRGEIRTALISWPAEEWWKAHH
jgi:DNA-binding CsgD family transcriptional regulator